MDSYSGGRRGGKARGRAAAPPASMQLERDWVLRGCRDGLAGFQDDGRGDRPVLGCETEHSEGDREGLSTRGNAKRPASAGLAVRGQLSEIERARGYGADGTGRLRGGGLGVLLLFEVSGKKKEPCHVIVTRLLGFCMDSVGQGVTLPVILQLD